MDREPNQNRPLSIVRLVGLNQATSFNIINNGILNYIFVPSTSYITMSPNAHGTVQNNAQNVYQVNNHSPIPNEQSDVEPNNNTVHQQFNQFVESNGQFLVPDHILQPVSELCEEPSYVLKRLTSIITTQADIERRRPIIIDGLNIGYSHGLNQTFSAKGLLLCAQFFIYQGFENVKILLPHHYRGTPGTENYSIITTLMKLGKIHFTPSRKIQNVRLTCYSDRIILDCACSCGGVVVSNDNFRDIYNENQYYKEIIEKRQLMFMFIGDDIYFPNDQYGPQHQNLFAFKIVHYPAAPRITT